MNNQCYAQVRLVHFQVINVQISLTIGGTWTDAEVAVRSSFRCTIHSLFLEKFGNQFMLLFKYTQKFS